MNNAFCITTRIAVLAALGIMACLPGTCAADTVDITLPASVSFTVTDISQDAVGVPNPTTVSYSNYVPGTGSTLRITIQGNAPEFTPPGGGGAAITVDKICWTAGAPVSGGTTYNGMLLDTDNAFIYTGTAASNSFDLTWSLAAIDAPVLAGIHSITATWKVESL